MAALSPWLTRTENSDDILCAALTARLAALLDRSSQLWQPTHPVPSHWYVQLFGPTAPQSTLSHDGHPPKGELVPPIAFPRRMFAGRRVEFAGDLRIGDAVSRLSRVSAITPKHGRSGPLCFVTFRHELSTPRGLAIVEEQDVVYRPAANDETDAPMRQAEGPMRVPDLQPIASRTLIPDATMLFRYSAITYNAHRIHYDANYARDIEAFPDLVVNGGLTTLLLWEMAVECFGRPLRRSNSRNLQPLFVDRPVTLCVAQASQKGMVDAWVQNDEGAVAVHAELEICV